MQNLLVKVHLQMEKIMLEAFWENLTNFLVCILEKKCIYIVMGPIKYSDLQVLFSFTLSKDFCLV